MANFRHNLYLIVMLKKLFSYSAPDCLAVLDSAKGVICSSLVGSTPDLVDTDAEGLTWTEY